ncbi:MAG TPA: polyprenyl synthetase family protein [Methanoregulaceae archaeon]|nr:polyprenyl synthetase family protein [Methanoregulaceae archaeon]HOV67655.1 polyprenyl synthetase family protein [Methanoregulaceae archaeon]HQJ87367.1 polyprenyl synthetase family protein [Methanoregulaceae archaeon]
MELDAYLEVAADHVDRLIDRYFGAPVGDLNRAAAHLLTAGGKRLRPALLMLAADAVRPHSSDDLMPAALALELTHTFTLIHDDIMDRDMFRRGVPTVNNRWDEPTAILAGDVLYSRAFSFLIGAIAPEAARLRAVGMLAITCDELCLGQHLDMSFASRDDVTEGEYLDMVEKKTGSLYAASAAIGAVLAGASEPQIEVLHRFGLACGVAFQIQDDLIDLLAPPGTSGKDRGSDIREGKSTLITILAREKGIDLAPYRRPLTGAECEDLIGLLTDHGVIGEVRERARRIVQDASSLLRVLPETEERRLLVALGEYFVTRGA